MTTRWIALATVPIALAVVLALLLSRASPSTGALCGSITDSEACLSVGTSRIAVELATTSAARAQGLSGRDALPPQRGMLFVFPEDGRYAFWMKDMRFAIDIVWIDREGRVVRVDAGVQPATFPATFSPPTPVRYVLELAAGQAAALGLAPGTLVSVPGSLPRDAR